MYTNYFGFNEKPFTLTPNPRFIFLSKNHKEAFAHLLYGINNHYGFIALIGEVGAGKTTVLRTLLGQLKDASYRSALIFNPCLTGVELLRSINTEFDIEARHEHASELLAELNRFLLAENAEGRTVVLVIDEAQNLKPEVLEQLRLISNLETEDDKLIQIVLSGQSELEILLERPILRQLNQRIAVRYRLRPMSMNETRAYIRHRMEVAGETGGVSFSRNAIRLIYYYARGVPRMINIICDRALLTAYGDGHRRISTWTVVRAVREVRNLARGRRIWLAAAGLAAVAAILTAGISHQLPARPHGTRTAMSDAPISAVASSPVHAPSSSGAHVPSVSKLEQEIRSLSQNQAHIEAFNTIAATWGRRPITQFSGQLTVPKTFVRLAKRRGLRLTTYNGSLDGALRFNLPFLVVTNMAGESGPYCVAVISAKNGAITVSPGLRGSGGAIRKDDLGAVAGGTFYLVWNNAAKLPDVITKDEKSDNIRGLQQLLLQAGVYHDAPNGTYSAATIRAVREFQHSLGIPANDSVGELTLAALNGYDGSRQATPIRENTMRRNRS